jgi:hypothetical protein
MLEINWTDTNGTSWDLVSGPVALMNAGVMGFGMPKTFDTIRQTALVHGQTLQSWRLEPRDIFLPITFQDDADLDVNGIQREFWDGLALGEYGNLQVTDSNGGIRSIDARFVSDGDVAFTVDPYANTHAFRPYGVSLVADDPWWRGPVQSFSFGLGPEGTATFFGNGSSATPFYIIKSTGGADSTLTNPGDQDAWITWTIEGPMTSFDLEIDGHHIGGDITVDSGDTLTIETSPLNQIAYLSDGTKVTRDLTSADFAPLPATGAPVNVGIDVVGTGMITASFSPVYWRAF